MATRFGTNSFNRLVGTEESDALFGLAGDDLLLGGRGNDFLDGGEGDDRLEGGAGDDVLFGGAGRDEIVTGQGNDFADGGEGDDVILGGSGRNTLLGGNGDDEVWAGAGDDFVAGGSGNDVLFLEAGDDRAFGEGGDDVIFGGTGHDELDGGDGQDLLVGEAGNDTLRGGNGDDGLNGLSGNDFIQGGAGQDVLNGGAGQDRLFGDEGNDNLRGGSGRDELHGGSGIDAILGEGGDDRIFAGEGNDSVDGDAQLRFYLLGANNSLVIIDPAQLDQTQTLSIGRLPPGVQLQGIDRRPADNLLYSIGSDNRIYQLDLFKGGATAISTLNAPFFGGSAPGSDADVVPVGVGFDFNPVPNRLRLVGDNDRNFRINVDNGLVADNDAATAGAQPDGALRYVVGDAAEGLDPNIVAVAYTNNVAGATSTILYGIDSINNTLVRFDAPNAGTLRTVGDLGFNVDADAAFDILSDLTGVINVAVLVSDGVAYQVDLTTGTAATLGTIGSGLETFQGFTIALVPDATQSGNDEIFGGNGDDVLSGNLGNDVIYGESGNDRLLGGSGQDVLVGGDGVDAFIFQSIRAFQAADFGRDTILDFQQGLDKILLSQTAFGPLTAASLAFVTDDAAVGGSSGTIVYSRGSGQLFYNQNGSLAGLGNGATFAQLNGNPNLGATDFVFV